MGITNASYQWWMCITQESFCKMALWTTKRTAVFNHTEWHRHTQGCLLPRPLLTLPAHHGLSSPLTTRSVLPAALPFTKTRLSGASIFQAALACLPGEPPPARRGKDGE